MMAVIEAINSAYGRKDTRSYFQRRALAAGLTIGAALLLAGVSLGLVAASEAARKAGPAPLVLSAIEWVLAAACLLFSLAVVYYVAPDAGHREWRWITPGAIVALALCLMASAAFRVYLHFFNSYSATYGSLGAVIILMLWFYLAELAIIAGAEVNAAMESAGTRSRRAGASSQRESERGVARKHPPAA